MQNYILFEEYITLGKLLKELGLIATGGQAKAFLAAHEGDVFYNHTPETRRGKKCWEGDLLEIPSLDVAVTFCLASKEEMAEHVAQKEEKMRVAALVKKMNEENKASKPAKKVAPRFPGRR
ncbi:hypothetical protein GHI93_01485 [Lactococcus hircilactis]|uniref:S4 domain-containing protein YaaA n=1 Tax=Lactococcus hircilactis TaxID=1494462 RepID=A0A7X1Z6N6_9LACT|nr:RNA-binding S4 domain-containing protein [Lactococcus hircilactis]MQW38621.1 hypothetical protein [Lactococcus hircilactis]